MNTRCFTRSSFDDATLPGVQQQKARRLLAWLLDVLGGMMSMAFLAVVMPTSVMAAIADWLGGGCCTVPR